MTDAQNSVPAHVAIIMDGNGRWAEEHGQPRHQGHRVGAESVRQVVETCAREGVKALTLFAFSSENWQRPPSEVGMLMELFMRMLDRETGRLHKNDIRLKVIGDRTRLSERLKERCAKAEQITGSNQRMQLNIAASYGGRWDLTQAAKNLAQACLRGDMDPADIDEAALQSRICLGDLPDPDLFIRTGGEQRISNFLLWHLAYTEMYFTPVLWPAFRADEMRTALEWFAGRQRRFGGVPSNGDLQPDA